MWVISIAGIICGFAYVLKVFKKTGRPREGNPEKSTDDMRLWLFMTTIICGIFVLYGDTLMPLVRQLYTELVKGGSHLYYPPWGGYQDE